MAMTDFCISSCQKNPKVGEWISGIRMAGSQGTVIEELREEVSRLQHELETTTEERLQAAEYGLAVLEEKQTLQTQYEELEAVLESTKHELDMAKEVRPG